MSEEEKQIAELKEQLHNLWSIASDLKSVIDRHHYGKIKYHGQIFQDTETYEVFIRFLQEFEEDFFGCVMTYPLAARSKAMSGVLLKPPESPQQIHCQYANFLSEL